MNIKIQEIWTDLHQELKKFIFSKVRDSHASEDILQDVFMKIHLNLHTLSDCSKLTSWVYQITRNTVNDYYRKINFEYPINDFNLVEQENDEPLYLSLTNCINLKISKLPEKYKQAILLTYYDNYSQITLSKELSISYSGAKTRVQRGRERLKSLIEDCKNVETDKKGNLIIFETIEA